MKTLLALKGAKKTGKSQTIRTVDELLRAKYPDAGVEHEHRTRSELGVVLSINGVRIGIESTGLSVSPGCDVIVCATKTKGPTVNAVNALPGYEVVWLEQRAQSAPFEQVLSNLAMARNIVDETEKSIVAAKPAVLSRAAGR